MVRLAHHEDKCIILSLSKDHPELVEGWFDRLTMMKKRVEFFRDPPLFVEVALYNFFLSPD